jgi:hypothetical protein
LWLAADRSPYQHHPAPASDLDRKRRRNRWRSDVGDTRSCGLEGQLGRNAAGDQKSQTFNRLTSQERCAKNLIHRVVIGEGSDGSTSAAAWIPPVSLYRSPLANKALNSPRS